MRRVGVVTGGRSDYAILRPVLRRLRSTPGLALRLYVTGTHLLREYGRTVREIARDGFPVAARVPLGLRGDRPSDIASAIGRGTIGFANLFARSPPDVLLLQGDRFEMLAAATAALPFHIPLAHIHGGESSEGAFDEAIRHALTKMSHLHFAATAAYARRIVQMGEDPRRVFVTGAPALDNLRSPPAGDPGALARAARGPLPAEFLLVVYHPVTLEFEDTDRQLDELTAGLDRDGRPVVVLYPNADTGSRRIIERWRRYARRRRDVRVLASLAPAAYFGLMSRAAAMIGNSSSGIVEAASFRLPVVNVGSRQRGRIHGPNVVDVPCKRGRIAAALRLVETPAFRRRLRGLANPYGDGHASERIVAQLGRVRLGPRLVLKRFHPAAAGRRGRSLG